MTIADLSPAERDEVQEAYLRIWLARKRRAAYVPPKREKIIGEGQGFASLPQDQRLAMARLGGLTAHAKGTAHQWDSYTASLAGRKGGLAPHRKTALGERATGEPRVNS